MYDHIERMIESLTNETESSKTLMETIESRATDAIAELESIKSDAEDTTSELDEYLTNLGGLQATLEKAERVRDEAETQNLDI